MRGFPDIVVAQVQSQSMCFHALSTGLVCVVITLCGSYEIALELIRVIRTFSEAVVSVLSFEMLVIITAPVVFV